MRVRTKETGLAMRGLFEHDANQIGVGQRPLRRRIKASAPRPNASMAPVEASGTADAPTAPVPVPLGPGKEIENGKSTSVKEAGMGPLVDTDSNVGELVNVAPES